MTGLVTENVRFEGRLLGFERRGQVFIESGSLVALIRGVALELDPTQADNWNALAKTIEAWRP